MATVSCYIHRMLLSMNNVKVLLNEEPFWQIPLKAREYVLLNMKKIGEIGEFSIYE